MHGEKLHMWLTKLQIAIIEKNTQSIDKLLDETPEFSDKKQMEQAMYLLREAAELMYELKNETNLTMTQIKKNINFLRSTEMPTSVSLDITS